MNVLIGSRALQYWNPSLKLKETSDYDVISDEPIEGTEWHNPDFLNNDDMRLFTTLNTIKFNDKNFHIMSMKGLAIIKRSHLWRNYKFQSHITQYHKFGLAEQFKKIELKSDTYKIYQHRVQLTKEYYNQIHPKLNKSKDEFFTDAVTRIYDHDLIHEIVAYPFNPIYTLLQPENPTSVWCSKDKWDKLSQLEKLNCVKEETIVTAIERYLAVSNPLPIKLAYIKSLDKICTTMCSGWFRDFAIDNYHELIQMINIPQIKQYVKTLTRSEHDIK